MRLTLTASLALTILAAAVSSAGPASARARRAPRVADPALVVALRGYRQVTWTYERIAHARRTPSAAAGTGPGVASPRAALLTWAVRADRARRDALALLRRKLGVVLPAGPGPASSQARQIAYTRRLVASLQRIVPAPAGSGRTLATARPAPAVSPPATLAGLQQRAAAAAAVVARLAPQPLYIRDSLLTSLLCIHHYEGAWTANTGNGYYGGLQMDLRFQTTYGRAYLDRWGTADHWPVWAQVVTARRAYRAGRGFGPWPNTARACGLRR